MYLRPERHQYEHEIRKHGFGKPSKKNREFLRDKKSNPWLKWIIAAILLAIAILLFIFLRGCGDSQKQGQAYGLSDGTEVSADIQTNNESPEDSKQQVGEQDNPESGTVDSNTGLNGNEENTIGKKKIEPISNTAVYGLGKTNVAKEDAKRYKEWAKEFVEANDDANVIIRGLACKIGSDEACDRVSLKRAEEVKKVLVSAGIPSDRIKVRGEGKCLHKDMQCKRNEDCRKVFIEVE